MIENISHWKSFLSFQHFGKARQAGPLYCLENMADIVLTTEQPYIQLNNFFKQCIGNFNEANFAQQWKTTKVEVFLKMFQPLMEEMYCFWEEAMYVKRTNLVPSLMDLVSLPYRMIQHMMETGTPYSQCSAELADKSLEELKDLASKVLTSEFSETLSQQSDFVKALSWLKLCAELTNSERKQKKAAKRLADSQQSSGTPKKKEKTTSKKEATSMSTTRASTTKADAVVPFSEDSSSSDDYLDSYRKLANSKQKTGTPGLNIFVQEIGGSYTFKSEEFPSGEMFINLSFSEAPNEVKKRTALEQWKVMDFRSKVLGKSVEIYCILI